MIQAVNQSLAKSFHLDAPVGALVSQVDPDSAAARAGLARGDVILEYNDASLLDAGQFIRGGRDGGAGDSAKMKIWRDGKTLDLTAKLGGVPGKAELVKTARPVGATLGLSVRPLTSEEANQSGIASGLLVTTGGRRGRPAPASNPMMWCSPLMAPPSPTSTSCAA